MRPFFFTIFTDINTNLSCKCGSSSLVFNIAEWVWGFSRRRLGTNHTLLSCRMVGDSQKQWKQIQKKHVLKTDGTGPREQVM